jgi:hypothetical protein
MADIYDVTFDDGSTTVVEVEPFQPVPVAGHTWTVTKNIQSVVPVRPPDPNDIPAEEAAETPAEESAETTE